MTESAEIDPVWKTVGWTTFCDDPAFHLGQVAMGAGFLITGEDNETLAIMLPPPKEHASSVAVPDSSEG
jgi:hypothetical protein